MNQVCTIDSNIWILNFSKKNHGYLNVHSWLKDNLDKYDEIKLSSIIPLEVLHNLSKDPRVEYEIPLSYVTSFIALHTVEIIDFNSIQLSNVMNRLSAWRMLGVGGRDAAIMDVLQTGETIITHDKYIMMVEEFRRIDPFFDTPLVLELGEKFNNEKWDKFIKEQLGG